MTVPVARASARRTVRLAAGLVAGQVVLGAAVGYVTLAGHGSGETTAGRMVDPLAAPTLVLPAPAVPPPSRTSSAPERPVVVRASTARPAAQVRSPHRPEVMPAPTVPAEPPPDILVATSPPATDSAPVPPSLPSPEVTAATSSTETTPPAPPPSAPTQVPVTVGDQCRPENAPGVTTDGKPVLCVSGSDGVLRWQPVD